MYLVCALFQRGPEQALISLDSRELFSAKQEAKKIICPEAFLDHDFWPPGAEFGGGQIRATRIWFLGLNSFD